MFSEEIPPKKRKLDAGQGNKSNSVSEDKADVEESGNGSKETPDEAVATESKDEGKSDNEESKESEKTKPAPNVPSTSSSNVTSSRSDLIKDIESHIEIIYECLDELNETGSSSSANKTTSNDIITLSSETSSQEADKSLIEGTENDGEMTNDPPAHDESKNE